MTNASILDRNIVHAFGAFDDIASVAEDAFWRFRNAHDSLCAEKLATLSATAFSLMAIAVTISPLISDATEAWRVRIELDDFMRERIHHYDGACACKGKTS